MAQKKPELAMPAGSMDALKAAVMNGADAVYFGAKKFNARITAENFSQEQVRDSVDFCHQHKKKAFLALNTLIKDSEMEEAIGIAKEAYCAGIDAVIVQDLGLIKALRALLPNLELHASTQMTCHNSAGAQFLSELGIKRIVLARELSLEEIRKIKKSCKAEIECFVHGALCFSYSGQCLLSSFLFNKSGNRGMCLQPCRLPYSLSMKGGGKKEGFLLSMKDLMTIGKIKELIDAGIDSFKIEGRQKGVEYVAAAGRAYRIAIDSCFGEKKALSKEDLDFLKIAFLRENSGGYFFGEKERVFPATPSPKGIPAAEVIGFFGKRIKLRLHENIGRWDGLSAINKDSVQEFNATKIFKGSTELPKAFKGQVVEIETGKKPYLEKGQQLFFTSSKRLKDFAYVSIKKNRQVRYKLRVIARSGEPLQAEAEFSGKKVKIVSGQVIAKSTKLHTEAGLIEGKVFKASDFFEPGEFSAEISGEPFLPLSELKKFKNQVMREMREALFSEYRKAIDEKEFSEKKKALLSFEPPIEKNSGAQKTAVFADSTSLLEESAKPADTLICHESIPQKEIETLAKKLPEKQIFANSSSIQSDSELAEFGRRFAEKGVKVVCSNLGALQIAIKGKASFWAGRELNIFNSLAAKLMIEKGAEMIIPSVECSLKQLKEMAFGERLAPLVFFYPVLMTSKAYAKQISQGFCAEAQKAYAKSPDFKDCTLKDRKGFEYNAVLDGKGILRLYNPMPVDMLFELEKFSGFGAIALDFTATSKDEATQALRYLEEKKRGGAPKKEFSKFTRGHYDREVF
ncbi:MAG: U32 family peptidase [Candidatus Diapherotrites archaeon]|nr:U32 family peptidase [Candidatus Diapherotrites archaeon]